jgi:Putative zinc-finger
MLNCREVSRLVSDSLDRKLGWSDWLGMRLHLMICENCRRFSRQLRVLRRILRRGADEPDAFDALPGLSDRARGRIEQALRVEQSGKEE